MAGPNVSDHQANERTFLAWLRTAIALMGFGFVVSKFGLFLRLISRTKGESESLSSAGIGIALVTIGGLMAALAGIRYRLLQRKIDLGSYEPGRWPMWVASASVTALAALLVGYLLQTNRL
ncbi:MAG: YidH family protein [Myxococcales bacterium]